MSDYKYNSGTRYHPSQNLAMVLGAFPFSVELGVLRTIINDNQIIKNNKILVL
jgi:hypothetical protein